MSLVQAMPERRPSSGNAALNLASNNPFRNRDPSPAALPVQSTRIRDDGNRAMSRNPFLDPSMATGSVEPPRNAATDRLVDDIFKGFSVPSSKPPLKTNGGSPPKTSMPPPDAPSSHRHARSRDDDDRRRARGTPKARPANEELNIFATPPTPKEENRRPRRNSESSLVTSKQAEDDRRRRERRKEREARREREGKTKDSKPAKPVKRPQGLDTIDNLDVTGIYGQGLFHHDGPFDACNPHRNRKKGDRAPLQAFPDGSANMTLSGSGVRNFDHDHFHGRAEEGFNEYNQSRAMDPASRAPKAKQQDSFNPTDRVEQVHGQETSGLGTSTFLEGAPAPRIAVQRRESDNEASTYQNGSGLSRKKSLAVRLRGISQPRRGDGYAPAIVSPNPRYLNPESPPTAVQSAGGLNRTKYALKDEQNPFFGSGGNANNGGNVSNVTSATNYDEAYEKKGAQIKIAETSTGRPRAESSSKSYGLTRSVTADSSTGEGEGRGGFLSRMKSMKGGRRTRAERTGSYS